MKNLGFLSLFLLVFVIFLSGCISQDSGPGGLSTGVIIKSFEPELEEVYPGEPVTLYITVHNVGDADAENTVAKLIVLNPEEWGSTSFPQIEIGTLNKAVPLENLPGDEWMAEWDLTAPSINTPQHTFTAGARVYYDYKTTATGEFEIVTYDYLKSLQPEEQDALKAKSALVSSTSSNAPIHVSFSTGNRPFIVYDDGQKFSFQIKITNVGQGNPIYGGDMYYMQINKPDIKGNVNIDCPSISGNLIKLMRGTSKTISCSIIVDNMEDINERLRGNVDVDLTYRYFVDAETTITVIKQV